MQTTTHPPSQISHFHTNYTYRELIEKSRLKLWQDCLESMISKKERDM